MGQCCKSINKSGGNQSSEELKQRGNELFKQGKFMDAMVEYQSAIKINSKVSVYHSNLAICSYKIKKFKECYSSANRALEIDDDNYKAIVYCIKSTACIGLEGDMNYFNISLKLCDRILRKYSKKNQAIKNYVENLTFKVKSIFTHAQQNEKKKSLLDYYSITLPPGQLESLQSLLSPARTQIPSLTCPLTLELFEDPSILESGNTYESKLIPDLQKHPMDPLTRKPINTSRTYPNISVKQAVTWYSEHYPDQAFSSDNQDYEI